ncbi:helix-turn-helix transcriptional regulator [Natronobiforma cellulositropha]|uniref:helix-turn-helix transcriptional regulator n=1 Tax=Natronobiforma cellulositropha TaxID=1679076 RepID=UPI0021D59FE7|nr:transcriptional regulator FilR1 domain-containing protein [Natronobiforma cellulositropha]
MDDALEEIEFLALSANRVAVLETLAGGRYTRRELEAATGASQPTLGRILRDFEERAWITRTDDGYEASATGRLVAAGITDLREIVETELRLREVVAWLPTEVMDVDLRALREATVTVPSRTRPTAPVDRVSDLTAHTDRLSLVSYAFNDRTLERARRRALEEGLTVSGVFSADALDAVADDATLRRGLRDLVAADTAEIRRFDGEIPLALTITDRHAHLLLRDDDGVLQASLDTDHPAVTAWARETYERYWEEATPLETGSLE